MRRPLKAGRAASMALTLFLCTNLMPKREPRGTEIVMRQLKFLLDVKTLRNQLSSNSSRSLHNLQNRPGVYRWWFELESVKVMFSHFTCIDLISPNAHFHIRKDIFRCQPVLRTSRYRHSRGVYDGFHKSGCRFRW